MGQCWDIGGRCRAEPEAKERSFVVRALNDHVFPPARVLVNGVGGSEISGVAEVSWRFRSGSERAVVFYTDGRDQACAGAVSTSVWSGGVRIGQADI